MIAKRIESGGGSNIARLTRYIVNAQGGLDPRSWEQTASYILDENAEVNDKGEKVGGVRVSNCFTDDPADATTLIQATQARNTRSKKDKTYHLVFSFPPGEKPPLDVLHDIEDELCASIGYADHQRISAVHIDTDHLHVHVAINKVHPTGHQNIEPYYDKQRLMEACERLEIKYDLERTNHGIGAEHDRHRERRTNPRLKPEQRPEQRDSRFRQHLRESNNLAIAFKPEAKTLNSLRNLSSCSLAHLKERGALLLSSHARHGLQQRGTNDIGSVRRAGNGDRAVVSSANGIKTGATVSTIEAQTGIETLASYVAKEVAPAMRAAADWQGVHEALAEHGLEIKPRGAGLVVGDSGLPLWVRASQCGRDLAMKSLTDRLGPYEAPKGKAKEQTKAGYKPKPVHQHRSTAQLFAAYQREKQAYLATRKAGMACLKKENETYQAELKKWTAKQRRMLKMSGSGATRRAMSVSIKSQTAAARNKHREVMKQKRERLYKKTSMPSWAEWLTKQADHGNVEALEVLRSRAQREQRLQGDLLTAENADRAKAVLMKSLKPATRRDGVVTYRTADGGMVVDRKTHVQAQKTTAGAALIALSLAAEKFDGQPLIVEGSDQFKQDVARLAGLHSFNVVFADPAMEQGRKQAAAEKVAGQTKQQASPPGIVPAGDKNDAAPKEENKSGEPSKAVEEWIKKRNLAGAKLSSVDYHRLWQKTDAGAATYQGRRKMEDGSEVLLLKRGDDMLVKPSSARVVARAAKWKIGRTVQLDGRGRFITQGKGVEL